MYCVIECGFGLFICVFNKNLALIKHLPSVNTSVINSEIGRAQRLNSSHANISYAVFCLKKKKKKTNSKTLAKENDQELYTLTENI